jgi:hypothetical protein
MQSADLSSATVPELERALDSFDLAARNTALARLCERARRDPGLWPPARPILNLHCHTFYSYNACGYSPSSFAWRARKAGLAAAGVVDFDVLDALEEFLEAGRLVGLKTCVSVETRVFVPEFATRVINSPGEPGIAYHMGVGFTSLPQSDNGKAFLDSMRRTVESRNRDLVARVNTFTRPVELDYDRDVLPLTPKGNATERHICEAYERKAAKTFPDKAALAAFWKEKLGDCPADSVKLQALIRSKTMKRGGIGYVQPGKGSFPLMADMNRFVLESGAIPTIAWLDGTTDGEKAIEELFEVAKSTGAAALNIIPDRNYTPGVKDQKVKNLYDVVALAEKHHFPIIVGTEMNAPGNKFVDSFETAELAPLVPVFLKGAHIAYAHSVLQQQSGMGYLSAWAQKMFPTVAAKNEFYAKLGRDLQPAHKGRLRGLAADATAAQVLAKIY